jgi:hypothetical protein
MDDGLFWLVADAVSLAAFEFEGVVCASTFALLLFFPEEKYTSSKNSCPIAWNVMVNKTITEINLIVLIFLFSSIFKLYITLTLSLLIRLLNLLKV